MATITEKRSPLRIYLEMIKFEHSIFALPFAMIGMMWGVHGWPGWRVFLLIIVAMVSCRSAAMAYNRIADREIDALNPRTKRRAIPAGLLSLRQVNLFFYASCGIFLLASALLNHLTLVLSPIALFVTLFYSVTKRFTPLCHFVLGLSLGIAPAAAWIASTGSLGLPALYLVFAVMFWTAGFDIIYALQDVDFDEGQRLRSLPQTIGRIKALGVSRLCHLLAAVFLVLAGLSFGAGPAYFAGTAFAAALLGYEQSLVKPDDLSKVNLAFFTLNGFVSIGVFAFALLDRLISK
ncbi:MAG: UbiA family prenyltransferase [Armatimonadetes bacterium]|nr:UbiA family prenyltransferase [Armatimonadota bacterium]